MRLCVMLARRIGEPADWRTRWTAPMISASTVVAPGDCPGVRDGQRRPVAIGAGGAAGADVVIDLAGLHAAVGICPVDVDALDARVGGGGADVVLDALEDHAIRTGRVAGLGREEGRV